MANVEDKFPENVAGSYYVDENCIACGVCTAEAPNNFSFTDSEDHAYVFKQPENDEERKNCEEALASCPTDAIGNDG